MIFCASLLLASSLAAAPATAAYVGVTSNARSDLTQMYDRSIARSLSDAGLLVSVGPSPTITACHDDANSCTAQNAAALQVGGWIRGTLTRDLTVMNVTLEFRAADGWKVFERSVSGTSDGAVLEQIKQQAPQWSREYANALRLSIGDVVNHDRLAGALLATGGAALAGATYLLLAGKSDYDRLDASDRLLRPEQAVDLAESGRRDQRIGVPLAILGAASVVTGVILLRMGHPPAPESVAMMPIVTGSSAGLAITGVLP